MPLHDDEPLEDLLAQSRDHAQQFNVWLDQLRAGDPAFAEASLLYPADMGEWQAAVNLLTGCDQVWLALARGRAQAKCRSHLSSMSSKTVAVLGPRARTRSCGGRRTSGTDRWPARFPHVFETYYFRRWVTACHLYKRITPGLPTDTGGDR